RICSPVRVLSCALCTAELREHIKSSSSMTVPHRNRQQRVFPPVFPKVKLLFIRMRSLGPPMPSPTAKQKRAKGPASWIGINPAIESQVCFDFSPLQAELK